MCREASMRSRLIGLILIVFCMGAGGPLLAQESTAELRGRVVDAQSAPVPGATLIITNQNTGTTRQAVSNADGTYFITAISPGVYALEATLSGFSKFSRPDIRLDLGRTTSIDVQLTIGNVTETVTVSSET